MDPQELEFYTVWSHCMGNWSWVLWASSPAFQLLVFNWKDTVMMTRVMGQPVRSQGCLTGSEPKGRRLSDSEGPVKKTRAHLWLEVELSLVMGMLHLVPYKTPYSLLHINPISVFLATFSQASDTKMGQKTVLLLRGQRNYRTFLAISIIFSTRCSVWLVQALPGVGVGCSI